MQNITSSSIAFQYLKTFFQFEVEEFWVLSLNTAKVPISIKLIARGTVDKCYIHPRDIFRFAIQSNASSIIIAHNHPSGDTTPSKQDILLTQKLLEISKLIGIAINDHLVISENFYSSFADQNWYLKNQKKTFLNSSYQATQ